LAIVASSVSQGDGVAVEESTAGRVPLRRDGLTTANRIATTETRKFVSGIVMRAGVRYGEARRYPYKEASMLKAMVTAVTLTFALSGAAWAADVQGKIKSIDTTEQSFVLEDGTKVWVGEGMPIEKLKEGSEVMTSYDEKDGKNVATSVEVKD
jgi:Protein of unknown function (DUF1344)